MCKQKTIFHVPKKTDNTSVHQSESKSVRTSSDKHCRVNTKIDQVKPQKEKVKVSQLQSASSSPDESSYESENDMYHADDNETSRLFKTSIIQDSVFKPASENEMSDIVATSRHIHLSTKDVNIELYERLGWFDNRPVAFWWENLLILTYGINALLNWLNISMCLLKGLLGLVASYFTFVTQITLSVLGLIHLILLPDLTESTNVTDYLQFLRHSKTSIMTRRLVHNWESKWRIYLLNLVLPWNMLFFQKKL